MRAIGAEPHLQSTIFAKDASFSLMELHLVKALNLALRSEAREFHLASLFSPGLMLGSATSSKAELERLWQGILARACRWMSFQMPPSKYEF